MWFGLPSQVVLLLKAFSHIIVFLFRGMHSTILITHSATEEPTKILYHSKTNIKQNLAFFKSTFLKSSTSINIERAEENWMHMPVEREL